MKTASINTDTGECKRIFNKTKI